MKLSNIKHQSLTSMFFSRKTLESDLIQLPFSSASDLAIFKGKFGDNNYIYTTQDIISKIKIDPSRMAIVENWSPENASGCSIFLLSAKVRLHIKTRVSGISLVVGNAVNGNIEVRYLNYPGYVIIGDDVTAYGLSIRSHGGSISIGRYGLISEEVIIQGHDGHAIIDLASGRLLNDNSRDCVIEDYVWIARRVTIMPGAVIGKGSIVGATSTVVGNIPSFCLVVGVPARVIRENVSWSRTRDAIDRVAKKWLARHGNNLPSNDI